MIFSVNLGNILLLASLVLSIYVLIASIMRERGNESLIRYVPLSIRAIAALLLSSTAYLTYLFYKSDFTYMYVWSYSSKTLPLKYKISAVWAGQEGTFLLWALLIFIALLWLNEKLDISKRTVNHTLIVSNLIGIFFIIMTILVSPFRSIYDLYPDLPPNFIPEDGNGLNPLLQDPWMAAHPPVMFIGYAAVTIPFAAALAHLWRRDKNWIKIAISWNRFSWLFLTLGIALGGFWSYKVLGWGGFWAWDPVETSSLIPWFTVTALAHAIVRNIRKGEFPVLTVALAVVSFWLVVYATFITRSGLWESVHAFGETTTGPYLAMLLVNVPLIPLILGIDYVVNKGVEASKGAKALVVAFLSAQVLVAIVKAIIFDSNSLPGVNEIAAIFALTGILFLILKGKFSSSEEKIVEVEEETDDKLFTMPNLFYSAIILLIILAFVSFWGLTYPFIVQALADQKIKVEVEFFNKWSFPFTVLLLTTIALCMGYGLLRKNDLIVGVAGSGVLGAVAYFREITPNPIVNFLLPFVAFAFVVSLYRTIKAAMKGENNRAKIARVSYYLIHVGVALVILGSMISTTMGVQEDVVFKFKPNIGIVKEIKDVGRGYAISVEDVYVYQNYEGYTVSEVLVKVYKNGKYIGEGRARSINNEKYGRVTQVYINRNIDHDVYVIFQGIGEHRQGEINIPLTVKVEPLINILWAGVFLLAIGILPALFYSGFGVEEFRKIKVEKVETEVEEI